MRRPALTGQEISMLDFNDAMELKRSILAVEAAVKAHHALLTKFSKKYGKLFESATPGRMQTLSGGGDKEPDDDDPPK
jgi:hypothetical protein